MRRAARAALLSLLKAIDRTPMREIGCLIYLSMTSFFVALKSPASIL